MKLFHLFRKKRVLFPRWFFETVRGNVMVRIGQDYGQGGDPEIVIQFQNRANFNQWKPIGKFRYLDVPTMKLLLVEVDKYLRSIIPHE